MPRAMPGWRLEGEWDHMRSMFARGRSRGRALSSGYGILSSFAIFGEFRGEGGIVKTGRGRCWWEKVMGGLDDLRR